MAARSGHRSTVVTLSAIALSLSLAAGAHAAETRECGGYPAPARPEIAIVPAGEGTASVKTEFGDVDLPTAPGAALGMYTTDTDILIWLGFPLAKDQPIRGDSGYKTFPCFFPQEALAEVTPFGNYPEYNYEQILLAEPDFILNGLGYDAAVNDRLPQIAPTYSVNAFDGRSWQDHFKETAAALGRSAQYEAWLATYRARVAEVRELIKDNADAVVAPLSFWNGTFSSGCYAGIECTVFRDLGLTIYEGALKDDGTGVEFSPEEVGQLKDVDYAFSTVAIGEQGLAEYEQQMAAVANNPVWSRLDIVTKQHIVLFEMEMVYGSPSGQLAFLEVVAKALSK